MTQKSSLTNNQSHNDLTIQLDEHSPLASNSVIIFYLASHRVKLRNTELIWNYLLGLYPYLMYVSCNLLKFDA